MTSERAPVTLRHARAHPPAAVFVPRAPQLASEVPTPPLAAGAGPRSHGTQVAVTTGGQGPRPDPAAGQPPSGGLGTGRRGDRSAARPQAPGFLAAAAAVCLLESLNKGAAGRAPSASRVLGCKPARAPRRAGGSRRTQPQPRSTSQPGPHCQGRQPGSAQPCVGTLAASPEGPPPAPQAPPPSPRPRAAQAHLCWCAGEPQPGGVLRQPGDEA